VARRCLIVDDNAAFLRAARELLERQGLRVVGLASTSAEAVALADHLRPEFALVDVDLGEESGFDIARALVEGHEALPVVLISAYAENDFTELIHDSPAVGFVSKSGLSRQALDELLDGSPNGRRGT
jgi:DNA-binding NarL/FixJ family response regulator